MSYRELKNQMKIINVLNISTQEESLSRKVKEVKRYEHEGISYVRVSEVPEEIREGFALWMLGQTYPIIPGLEAGDAVYSSDWNRYLVKLDTGIEIWD